MESVYFSATDTSVTHPDQMALAKIWFEKISVEDVPSDVVQAWRLKWYLSKLDLSSYGILMSFSNEPFIIINANFYLSSLD